MPYLPTAQQWLTQSTLLLTARPSTTRITTKYTHASTVSKKANPKTRRQPEPTALLTLKTYDPDSGTTLKYQTNKAAEVGRLVQILGRLGRGMAGLEEREEVEVKEEEIKVEEVKVEGGKGGVGVNVNAGGGKGKKKKGKK